MDLCTGGTLQNLIDSTELIPTDKTLNLCIGMLNGLTHLHSKNLMHLDLKPENLFLCDEAHIKIGDFGLCLPEHLEAEAEEGDREYMAPELLNEHASHSADIFSAGLILYQMLLGIKRLPGNGEGWIQLRDGQMRLNLGADRRFMGDQALKMIQPEPSLRPSAFDAMRALQS